MACRKRLCRVMVSQSVGGHSGLTDFLTENDADEVFDFWMCDEQTDDDIMYMALGYVIHHEYNPYHDYYRVQKMYLRKWRDVKWTCNA